MAIFKDVHEPIINREDFERVQEKEEKHVNAKHLMAKQICFQDY